MLKDENLHPVLKEVLRIRARLGKTSIKKYIAMRDSLCKDGRAHNLFQFYGAARTGRWAGRNIQLQNLPSNYIDDLETAREAVKSGDIEWVKLMYGNVPDTLSQLIRTAIVPAPGKKFVVADFSAIEARVLAWLADETWVTEAFRNGKDIYCETASQMFGVPVEKHGQNSELRQKGKVATLACGYGGGVGALKAMGGDKMGLSDDEMQHIVDNWRKASPNIVTFWARLERAARIAVQRHQATTLPHGIKFMWNKGHMIVQLPSKRVLVYLNVRMGENRFGNPSIVYDGVDMAKKAAGAALAELETYSGKLAENITQAVARDCLAIAMKKVEAAGYPIVAHIHDELVLEVPDTPEYNLATAIDLMTQNVGWNKGLPLNAAGFESYFYMKD
jgi:DNA polymerase